MWEVKSLAVTIRLEPKLEQRPDKACKQWGRSVVLYDNHFAR
jgi:hypothetical protein